MFFGRCAQTTQPHLSVMDELEPMAGGPSDVLGIAMDCNGIVMLCRAVDRCMVSLSVEIRSKSKISWRNSYSLRRCQMISGRSLSNDSMQIYILRT